jgi:hypothetical protein
MPVHRIVHRIERIDFGERHEVGVPVDPQQAVYRIL